MLLVPVTDKINWRNPPVLTIALILLNVVTYFFFQTGDASHHREARAYYFNSGLAEMELPLYTARKGGRSNWKKAEHGENSKEKQAALYREMLQDDEFQHIIRNRQLIPPDTHGYAEWRELRARYQTIRSKILGLHFGFTPADPSILTAFTHTALHRNALQLAIHMVFLWIAGCLLEIRCGRLFTLSTYLTAALTAVLVFWGLDTANPAPLTGPAAAIAGIIGALAVIVGMRRVKIFYSLGFYFNYIRFPAVLLLLFWIGNESYQMLSANITHLAGLAHLAGLISGGAMGLAAISIPALRIVEPDDPATDSDVPVLIEKALQRVGLLDMDGGRLLVSEALEKEPHHREALILLFDIEKIDPQSPAFHQAARRLMTRLCLDHDHAHAYDVYMEYASIAAPRLSPALYVHLSMSFAKLGHTGAAEKIVTMLLKKRPAQAGLPAGLLQLSRACDKKGDTRKRDHYLTVLCEQYPASPEARRIAGRPGAPPF